MIADIVPVNLTALVIVLLAIVPGYLTVTIWGRLKTWKGRTTDLTTVVESIIYSAVIQVIALPFTLRTVYLYRDHLESHQYDVAKWLAIIVLGLPIVVGTLWAWLSSLFDTIAGSLQRSERRFLSWLGHAIAFVVPTSSPPTTWDLVFKEKIPDGAYLVVTFDDGRQVAGRFNQLPTRRSHVLTSPHPHGLYLAQEYALDSDGNIYAEISDSKGVMLLSTEHIRSVRFLNPGEEDTSNDRQGNNQGNDPGRDQGGDLGHNQGSGTAPAANAAAAHPGSAVAAALAKHREGLIGAVLGILLTGGPIIYDRLSRQDSRQQKRSRWLSTRRKAKK